MERVTHNRSGVAQHEQMAGLHNSGGYCAQKSIQSVL